MKINVSALNPELNECVKDCAEALGFELCADGRALKTETAEGLTVRFDGKDFTVGYPENAKHLFFRGLRLIKQNGERKPYEINETRDFTELGIMLDCSRNAVRNERHVREIIRTLALMGYNELQLYTEDTYEVDGEPHIGYMRGRYTKDEMKRIDAYAARFGIEVVPCIQTLAHLNQIFRWGEYDAINDTDDILLIDDERTYTLIDNMFRTLSECYASRKIHIGMDEAHMIGRGKYEDRHGAPKNRADIMLRHLNRVVEIAGKYGYRPMMWSDMFFRLAYGGQYYVREKGAIDESVRELVPKNLRLVYWDYYNTDSSVYEAMIDSHLDFDREVMFAGGAWMWSGFTPSNRFAMKVTDIALDACKEKGVDKIMLTMWGDDGAECSDQALLPTLVFAAEKMYGGNTEAAFKALTDVDFDKFMKIEIANDIIPTEDPNHLNPSKYLLYNDCVGGMFDYTVREGDSKTYAEHAKMLKAIERKAGRYSYIFATQRALCSVLSAKVELGVKARAAYKNGDRKAIKALVKEGYMPLFAALEDFYACFQEQWEIDNKPFGFEVQDYRIGGLIRRVQHCAEKLIAYADGAADRIPEFDEVAIESMMTPEEAARRKVSFNRFGRSIGANIITW